MFGTGASTSVFGAIMTLVIAARLYTGKSPVGSINPVIYKYLMVLSRGGIKGAGPPDLRL